MSTFEAHEVVYAIADISGYTDFVVSHGKALAHGQMVVSELLRTLVEQIEQPMALSRLEGDAVFAYMLKDEVADPDRVSEVLRGFIPRTFNAFHETKKTLAHTAICKCPACANIDGLQLKLVIHSGDGILSEISGSMEFAGVDVIVVHRLMKNSVELDDYLLMTEPARVDARLDDSIVLTAGEEDCEGIGAVTTHVTDAKVFLAPEHQVDPSARAFGLAYEVLRQEIRREYAQVAQEPEKGFHFHTGAVIAARLGYTEEQMASVPALALESFAGTGNPHQLGALPEGANVVDVGCGAGFDALIAAAAVGATGRVVGVDMTPEMLAKARKAVAESGRDNVEIRPGLAEDLPVSDGWADVVISNGVINLCPDKPRVFAEIFRVLKPGGALQVGDILVEKPVPPGAKRNIDLWAA